MPQSLDKKLGISINELKSFIIDKNYNENKTQKEIYKILGCDQHTLVKWMKKLK